MKNLKKMFVVISMSTIPALLADKKPIMALTIVPVADLVGTSLQTLGAKNVEAAYLQLPIDDRAKGNACLRVHQVLFNEIVEIINERGAEVHVRISNAFFKNAADTKPQVTYWALKRNFVPLSKLQGQHLDLHKIPQPINFKTGILSARQQIIALKFPFFDPITQQTYSAGTRFVYAPTSSTPDFYTAYAFDPRTFTFKKISIPQSQCINNTELRTKEDKVKQFVQLIHSWAHLSNGFIIYVWGGCSCITITTNPAFTEKSGVFYGHTVPYFELDDYPYQIKTGLDCAGMVLRAAQICGMPYFYKNTYTLAHNLKTIAPGQKLKDGDLIWIRGHVMVVGSRKKNTLLEARSFAHGFGKVQEISLAKSFKGIRTFAELEDAFFNKKVLLRLHADGSALSTITDFKLLDIYSLWH